jgi:hypothetical protein
MRKILFILLSLCSLTAFGQHQWGKQVTISGTDTYTTTIVTPTPPPNYNGLVILGAKFPNTNTGASTFNVTNITGAGAVALRYFDGDSWEPLTSGYINTATIYKISYNGSYFQLEANGSGSGGGGTVEGVTGDGVDNTDPANPVLTFPVAGEVLSSPAGNISAANVQIALEELDDEKEPLLTFTASDFNEAGQTVSIDYTNGQAATSGQKGFLTSADWTTFNSKAPLASPAFTGTPTAPTASANTNNTQIATTAYADAKVAESITNGVTGIAPSQDQVFDALALKAATTDVVGGQDLFVSAVAMWPTISNGCDALATTEMATSAFNVQSLDFDQTTQQFAQMQFVFPRNWNNGTITATVYWTAGSGTGGVVWGISGAAYSNDDAMTVAFGTAQTVSDTFIAANDLHITSTSSAITLAGSPADADFIAIQISRNPADGSDTLTADAKLLGIRIVFTTDAAKSE